MGSSPAPAPASCRNCDAELSGQYCSDCGQQHKPLDPSLRELVRESVHELAELDGRLLATTRALFFHPGTLTAEFLAGRRARYIGPLRLYLTFSVLFFLVVALAPKLPERSMIVLKADPVPAGAPRPAPGSIVGAVRAAGERPAELESAFLSNFSRVMFVLVPFFAAVLRLVYRRSGLRYPAFVYFALHHHAVMFAALAVAVLSRFTHNPGVSAAVEAIAFACTFVYLFVALRTVFGGSKHGTLARMALTGALYLPGYLVALAAAAAVSIFSMAR